MRPGCAAGSRPHWRMPRPGWNARSPRSNAPPAARSGAPGSCRSSPSIDASRSAGPGWAARSSAAAINREAKLLQLTHAFEVLGANRVEFKTHARNDRSRAALAGIGATFEGVFRNHMILPDGSIRHSAYFSVIAEEWPDGEGGPRRRPRSLIANRRSLDASAWRRGVPCLQAADDGIACRPADGGIALKGFIVGTAITAIAFYVLTEFLPQAGRDLRGRADRPRRPRRDLRGGERAASGRSSRPSRCHSR